MNTTAPLFAEQNQLQDIEKNIAEMYARMYAIAAEDFTTTQDVKTYITTLTQWMKVLQQQITALMKVLSTHTHMIPPHTHPIPPHTHICSGPGGTSSPNLAAFVTSPTPLQTNSPVEAGAIKWNDIAAPNYQNTTGVTPNYGGNTVIVGPTSTGPFAMVKRRAKPPTATLKPTILPLVKDLPKAVI